MACPGSATIGGIGSSELYAKAVSGTAIRISMNKVPMMIILDFVTLSPQSQLLSQRTGTRNRPFRHSTLLRAI